MELGEHPLLSKIQGRMVRKLESQGSFQSSERKMSGWIYRAHRESTKVADVDRPSNDTVWFMCLWQSWDNKHIS